MPEDSLIVCLENELITMGFPERMAKKMASEAFTKAGIESKSIHNNLPAFLVDGGKINLIDTSMGLK